MDFCDDIRVEVKLLRLVVIIVKTDNYRCCWCWRMNIERKGFHQNKEISLAEPSSLDLSLLRFEQLLLVLIFTKKRIKPNNKRVCQVFDKMPKRMNCKEHTILPRFDNCLRPR